MGLGTLVAIQAGLWLVSYLLREDPEEDGPDPDQLRKGSTTVAEEGTIPALVIGRARVRKTNVILHEGSQAFSDYIDGSFFDVGDYKKYYVSAMLGVCVRPLIGTNFVKFERIWFGDRLAAQGPPGHEGGLPATPAQTIFDIDRPNFWGGPGRGGGLGGLIDIIYVNGIATDRIDSSVRVTYGEDAIQQQLVYQGMVDRGPNRGPAPTFTPGAGGLPGGNNYGASPGLCTLTLLEFNVGERPVMPGVSVEMTVFPRAFGPFTAAVGGVEGVDANPIGALHRVLTDNVIGLGLPGSVIDGPSFQAASDTLNAEGNGFSIALERPTPAKKIVEMIIKQIDGVLYMDPQTGRLHIRLIREDYGAFPYAGLDIYDDDDVVEVVDYKETSWDDTFSQVRIGFEDRDAEYAERYAITQDISVASQAGRTNSIDVDFPGVKTAALANQIAARELKFYSTPQLLVTLKLKRRGSELRPGDVFKWTWQKDAPDLGFHVENMVLRVHQVDLGTYDDGVVTVTCSRDKYSNVATTFADPDRHWLDDYGVRPEAPDCYVVEEAPPNPFFEEGGSNWTTPEWGTLVTLISPTSPVIPPTSLGQQYGMTLEVEEQLADGGHGPTGRQTDWTPCGTVGVAYAKTVGPYYDTGTGLVISLPDMNASVLRTSTEADVRKGRSVIRVGEEYMSYETFTDLGGGSYRLNNVWRGLFDTVAVDHAVDDPVFFLSEVDMGRVTQQKRFACGADVSLRVTPFVEGRRQSEASPYLFNGVVTTRRQQRAARPTQFVLHDDGVDAVGSVPEVNYAFDESNPQALVRVPPIGANGSSSGIDLGEIFTNDLRGTWNRRPRVVDCENVVVRGDDADQPYSSKDDVRLRVQGKGDAEASYRLLQDFAYDGVNPIADAMEFVDLSTMPLGAGTVRVLALRPDDQTGEELDSHAAEEIIVDMVTARQLILNRKFRPSWDLEAASAGEFGSGRIIVGNALHHARKWRDVGSTQSPAKFEVPGQPLVQGADDEGFAFTADFTANQEAQLRQVVALPYRDTENSALNVMAWIKRPSVGELNARIFIEILNAAGAVLDSSNGTFGAISPADTWQKIERTLVSMSPAARALRLTVGLDPNTNGSDAAMSDLSVVMGPDLDTDQLVNGSFQTLASWTQTIGVWRNPGSVGSLNPVDESIVSPTFLQGPLAGANALIEQTVALPAEYGAGDYARLQFWAANVTDLDTISGTLTALDSGAGAISSKTSGGYVHQDFNQWYFHEVYLKIPPLCTDVKVDFKATLNGAAAMNCCVDEVDLTFVKSAPKRTEFNWKNARLQPQPLTPGAFSRACGNVRCLPSHIFPLQEGPGQDPIDVVQGVTFDSPVGVADQDYSYGAEAVGLYNGTDHVSKFALELSGPNGGTSCTDLEFLNPNGRSFGIYVQFRLVEGLGGAANLIMKIAQHLGLGPDEHGFQLWYDEASHRLFWDVEVNSTAAGYFNLSCNTLGTCDDAAWHWAYVKFDTTAKVIAIMSDFSAEDTDNAAPMIDGLAAQGEVFRNNADRVYIGRNDVSAGPQADGFDNPCQIGYWAVLRDKAAEKFTKAEGDAMFQHGLDQNELDNGYGITYTRTNRVAYPIGPNHVAMWGGSGGGGPVQVPLQYDENFTGDSQLGLGSDGVIQNAVPFPNRLSDASWTKTGAQIGAARLVSERGMREMQVVEQTALGGHARRTITGLLPSTTYTFSGYIQTVGIDHDVLVEVTQNDLATVLTSATFSADQTNLRYGFTFTTQVGQNQLELRLYGGTLVTANQDAGFHGVMIHRGSLLGPVIYNDINQNGSLESTSAQSQSLVTSANEITNAEEMSLQALYVQKLASTGNVRFIAAAYGAVGNEEGRICRILASGAQDAATFDAGGVLVQNGPDHPVLTPNQEISRIVRWRGKTNLAHGAFTLQDIVESPLSTQTNAGTYSVGAGHTRLFIGCDTIGTSQLSGPLQTLRLFTGEMWDYDVPS